MVSVREREWTDEELAEITIVVMEWFNEKGRQAALLVQALDDFDADRFAEGVSWLEDLASGEPIDG